MPTAPHQMLAAAPTAGINWDAVAALLGSASLAVTLVVGLLVWLQTRRHFAYERTLRFIERWNDPDLQAGKASLAVTADRITADPRRAFNAAHDIIHATDPEDAEHARRVSAVVNILQELGAAHKRGVVHHGLADDVFASLIVQTWESMHPYVLATRWARRRPTLLEDWEQLVIRTLYQENPARLRDAGLPERPPRAARDLFADTAVFAYGSLMNPASAGRSINGPLRSIQLARAWPARLRGYRRLWNYTDAVHHEDTGNDIEARFLGIRPDPDAACNGTLVPVTHADLEALKKREFYYKRVDVTAGVEIPPELANLGRAPKRVLAYVVDESRPIKPDTPIATRYLGVVADALTFWGKDFADEYQKTTESPESYSTFEGNYT